MMQMLKWWAVGVAIALIAVAGSGTVVRAHEDNDDNEDNPALAAQLVQSGDIRPLEEFRTKALEKGTILKTELDHEWGRYVYKVKIRDAQGLVWKMKFDAQAGVLLREYQDD